MKILGYSCMYPFLTLRELVRFKEKVVYSAKRGERKAPMKTVILK
jgi:hypothetical protein